MSTARRKIQKKKNRNSNQVKSHLVPSATYSNGMPLLSPIFTFPFGDTLIKFVFGTMMYFRPATIAIDCGGDTLMSSCDRFEIKLAVGGTHVVTLPMTLLFSLLSFDRCIVVAVGSECVNAAGRFNDLSFGMDECVVAGVDGFLSDAGVIVDSNCTLPVKCNDSRLVVAVVMVVDGVDS